LCSAIAPQHPDGFKLLPTPTTRDSQGGQQVAKRRAGGHEVDLCDVAITLFPLPAKVESLKLLPTPRASDGTRGARSQQGSHGSLMLPSAVLRQCVPTPLKRPVPA